jgi:hypothetical protein
MLDIPELYSAGSIPTDFEKGLDGLATCKMTLSDSVEVIG